MQIAELTPHGKVRRVILGAIIDAYRRKTFPLLQASFNGTPAPIPLETRSGSIGFADFSIRRESVPHNFDTRIPCQWNPERAVVITEVGIEPKYRRQGYGSMLMRHLEGIARRNHLRYVVAKTLMNRRSERFMAHLGYQKYYDDCHGSHALKLL